MKNFCILFISIQTFTTAFSQVITFSASDPGAVEGGPRPNSASAAAAFNTAAGALGPVSTINFEALTLGQFSSRTLASGVTASQVGYDTGIGGIVTSGYATPVGAPTGFNTTPGGAKFLGFVPTLNIGTATLDFAFSTPIQAWGAYIVGLESSVAGTVNLQFNDGSLNSFPLQDLSPAGVQYFAFTDPGRSIVHVTLVETGITGTRDIFGVDDLSYVVVPEPATAALLCLGCATILMRRRA